MYRLRSHEAPAACIFYIGDASNLSLIYYHREHGESEISGRRQLRFLEILKKKYFVLAGLPSPPLPPRRAVVEDPSLVS